APALHRRKFDDQNWKNHVHNSDIHYAHGGAENLRYNHDSLSLPIVSSVTDQKVYPQVHHQWLYGKSVQYGHNRNKTWYGLRFSVNVHLLWLVALHAEQLADLWNS